MTNWTGITTNKAEIYDPTTGVWTPTTPLPTIRHGYSATSLLDGTVLVAGGNEHPDNVGPGTNLNTALIYDPSIHNFEWLAKYTGPSYPIRLGAVKKHDF